MSLVIVMPISVSELDAGHRAQRCANVVGAN